jgi:hypothetical protein
MHSRLILAGIVLLIGLFLGFLAWRFWVGQREIVSFTPKSIELVDRTDMQRVETACYEMYLPKDFEVIKNMDCRMGAYARPRKHSYFQVSPYYAVDSEEEMLVKWRERWLTLGAEERTKDRIVIGGRLAWRLVDYYPQNKESFVTYLVFLDAGIRVDGKDLIRAFELRGWSTSEADQSLIARLIQDWHWRF